MTIHVVSAGETIYSIAAQYNVPARQIMDDNAIINPNLLTLGQALLILEPDVTYQVQQGDRYIFHCANFGVSKRITAKQSAACSNRHHLSGANLPLHLKILPQKNIWLTVMLTHT